MRFRAAFALSFYAVAACADPPTLELTSRLTLTFETEAFGGISGLLVGKNGQSATMLSDRAKLFEIRLDRNASGTLINAYLDVQTSVFLDDPDASPDTEGLAAGPGGAVHVSLESPPVILTFQQGSSQPDAENHFLALDTGHKNRGMEALATDTSGRLITIPEIVPEHANDFPVLRLENGAWRVIHDLPVQPGFMVTGADVGPDGHLYVLERAVSFLGFRSQIRRIDLNALDRRADLIFRSGVAELDNMEGIAVWTDYHENTHITLISDDNFNSVQKTELVEFLLRR